MDVHYNEQKFTEMLLYVADRLRSDRSGGATKLNKVVFFADFAHVRRTGSPISGAQYQKLPWGPAPRRLVPVRDQLIAAGDAHLEHAEFLGRTLQRVVPDRAADVSVFSDEELATIDQVLSDLDGLTAVQVSDLSHEEPGWRLVEEGETIPYEAALVGAAQVSTPTARRLQRDIAEQHGLLPT